LFTGTAPATKASTLLPSLKTSFSALGQDQDKKDDKKVKEKHACKGQNSCKGKGGCKAGDNGCKGKNSCKGTGGCATDGSKPPGLAPAEETEAEVDYQVAAPTETRTPNVHRAKIAHKRVRMEGWRQRRLGSMATNSRKEESQSVP